MMSVLSFILPDALRKSFRKSVRILQSFPWPRGSRGESVRKGILVMVVTAMSLAGQPAFEPALYVDEGVTDFLDPLAEVDRVDPEKLSAISAQYTGGQYRLAVLCLRRLNEMNVPDGNRDVVLLMLAESYRKLGLNNHALPHYREITRHYTQSPYRVFAGYRLVDHYYRIKDYEACNRTALPFETHYKRHKLYGASQYIWAKSLVRQKRYEDAIEVLKRIPKGSAYYHAGNFLNGLCQAARGNTSKALVFFDFVASVAEPKLADASRLVQGDLYYGMGKFAIALTMYEKISETGATSAYVYLRKANASARLKKHPEAADYAGRILRDFPGSEYLLEACLLLERIHTEAGEPQKAAAIQAYVDEYVRRFRSLFLISSELMHLSELTSEWSQLAVKAGIHPATAARVPEKLLKNEFKRIDVLKKKLQKLQELVDPSGHLRSFVGSARFAEQRYLEIMTKRINELKADSADLFGEIKIAELDLEGMEEMDEIRAVEKRLNHLEKSYEGVLLQLKDARLIKARVILDCAAAQGTDHYSENLQAKFVDWGMLRLNDLKAKIQQHTRIIAGEATRIRDWKKQMETNEKTSSTPSE